MRTLAARFSPDPRPVLLQPAGDPLGVVDRDWIALLGGLAREFGIRRRVELRSSPAWPIPVTWGVVRPVILLPRSGLRWPEPVRRAVLLHELAHVARSDVAFLMIGRLATAAFWFHPLAWYALHRLRVECEHASDDLVIRAGVRSTIPGNSGY